MTKPEKTFYIPNDTALKSCIASLSKITPTNEKPYAVRVTLDTEGRSTKQNRLAFSWYKERAAATGNGIEYERHFCKMTYGVPILSNDTDFMAFYTKVIATLSYEDALDAMAYIPVTRIFKVKEFAEYLNTTDRESAAQGIILSKPDDLYYEALMKENEQ